MHVICPGKGYLPATQTYFPRDINLSCCSKYLLFYNYCKWIIQVNRFHLLTYPYTSVYILGKISHPAAKTPFEGRRPENHSTDTFAPTNSCGIIFHTEQRYLSTIFWRAYSEDVHTSRRYIGAREMLAVALFILPLIIEVAVQYFYFPHHVHK